MRSSVYSVDVTESEGSTVSLYENMHPLTRSRSAYAIVGNDDPGVTQSMLSRIPFSSFYFYPQLLPNDLKLFTELLEHDTSL